ncbi:MAG: hypothetical protein M1813_006631 [Trichoglossum hirsutum]|nr:MAG: hypothetical protein M1813_006631 [Trichoglossum hirsutum]
MGRRGWSRIPEPPASSTPVLSQSPTPPSETLSRARAMLQSLVNNVNKPPASKDHHHVAIRTRVAALKRDAQQRGTGAARGGFAWIRERAERLLRPLSVPGNAAYRRVAGE